MSTPHFLRLGKRASLTLLRSVRNLSNGIPSQNVDQRALHLGRKIAENSLHLLAEGIRSRRFLDTEAHRVAYL